MSNPLRILVVYVGVVGLSVFSVLCLLVLKLGLFYVIVIFLSHFTSLRMCSYIEMTQYFAGL